MGAVQVRCCRVAGKWRSACMLARALYSPRSLTPPVCTLCIWMSRQLVAVLSDECAALYCRLRTALRKEW